MNFGIFTLYFDNEGIGHTRFYSNKELCRLKYLIRNDQIQCIAICKQYRCNFRSNLALYTHSFDEVFYHRNNHHLWQFDWSGGSRFTTVEVMLQDKEIYKEFALELIDFVNRFHGTMLENQMHMDSFIENMVKLFKTTFDPKEYFILTRIR